MQCMTYELSPSLIPRVASIVDIEEEVMNIMELVIQVLKLMYILCHVQILKLIENHPLKLGICRSSFLRRLINLNGHGLWIIFSLVSSTCVGFMVICTNFNICTLISFNQPCVAYLGESHFVHIDCGNAQ